MTPLACPAKFIEDLPGPGTYPIEYWWEVYQPLGTALISTGTHRTQSITVTSAFGTNDSISASGHIYTESSYDEDGNQLPDNHSSDFYSFNVGSNGTLRVTLIPEGGCDINFDGVSADSSISPGNYTIRVYSDTSEGNYQLDVHVDPSDTLSPPSVTTASLPDAALGTAYPTGVNVTTDIAATTYFAGGLPLGLTCDPATGQIHGTPLEKGTFDVRLWAVNDAGHGKTTHVPLTVGRGIPTLTVTNQTAYNLAFFKLTTDMLPSQAAAPATGLPAPTGTVSYIASNEIPPAYTIDPLAPSNTAAAPLFYSGLRMTDGRLKVTASYPGDANYQATQKVVYFQNRDTLPPSVPGGVQATLVGKNSLGFQWAQASDNSGAGLTYDVSLNGGATVFATAVGAASFGFNGLSPGTTYQLAVRARDASGNLSGWTSVSATTGTASAATSRWVLNSSTGLYDEYISPDPARFTIHALETASLTVDYTDWSNYYEYVPGQSYGDGYYVGGYWMMVPFFDLETITYSTTRPSFQFETLPGYQYTIVREVVGPNGTMLYPKLFSPTTFEHIDADGNPTGGIDEFDPTSPNGGFLIDDIFYAFPTTLVRYSLAPGGCVLPIPGIGTVTAGGAGTLNGTVKLPGGITVSAGTGSGANTATVSIPTSGGGTAKITIDSNGHPTGTPPDNVSVVNGQIVLPGGVTVSAGAGTATIRGSGGASITVGSGGIKLSLPQGVATVLGGVIDAAGKVLGVGGDPSKQKINVDNGDWNPVSSIDLGSLGAGTHTVGVGTTADDNVPPTTTNTVTITLTIAPALPLPRFEPRPGQVQNGWDAYLEASPWTSVVVTDTQGGQNQVVQFHLLGGRPASSVGFVVDVGSANLANVDGNGRLLVAPGGALFAPTGAITNLPIFAKAQLGTGDGPWSAQIVAKSIDGNGDLGSELARLKISILKQRSLKIHLFKIIDSDSSATNFDQIPSMDQLKTTLNSMYAQAGICFEAGDSATLGSTVLGISYDSLNPDDTSDTTSYHNGKLDFVLSPSPANRSEWDELKVKIQTYMDARYSGKSDFVVCYFKDSTKNTTVTLNNGKIYTQRGGNVAAGNGLSYGPFLVSTGFNDSIEMAAAAGHEIGHVLQIAFDDYSSALSGSGPASGLIQPPTEDGTPNTSLGGHDDFSFPSPDNPSQQIRSFMHSGLYGGDVFHYDLYARSLRKLFWEKANRWVIVRTQTPPGPP